ncbi:DUF2066 domain-containing protein [Mesorhizobium sp. 1B3]|uniref:DUF2066 domain-containing protein n=1 Tax=Mesorhizobium sp. 1B3 TaxID=3243599 RepID=UPI003D96B1C4
MPRRVKLLCLALALVLPGGPLLASDSSALYGATTVTSGTGEKNRARALALCLVDVLVKVSGDPTLADDPRIAEMAGKATTLVAAYDYRDLLNDRPPNHEQGTYDRPQYLTAKFEPAAIDAALAALGRKPWLSRPRVAAFISVETMKGETFALDGEGKGMEADMRGSVMAAADRTGIPLVLPVEMDFAGVPQNGVALKEAATANGGDVGLSGTMIWRAEALGWIADWTLVSSGKEYRWQEKGVGFDDAFRNAMRATARILSNHGQPE